MIKPNRPVFVGLVIVICQTANAQKKIAIVFIQMPEPDLNDCKNADVELSLNYVRNGGTQRLASTYPSSKLWASWTLPTWSIIERMKNAGVSAELLGKPYLLSSC